MTTAMAIEGLLKELKGDLTEANLGSSAVPRSGNWLKGPIGTLNGRVDEIIRLAGSQQRTARGSVVGESWLESLSPARPTNLISAGIGAAVAYFLLRKKSK